MITIPKAEESEKRLISALMTNKDSALIATKIRPHHFYNEKYKTIYGTIQKIISQGQDVDLISVSHFNKDESINDVFLTEICMEYCGTASVPLVEKEIIEAYRLRRLVDISSEVQRNINEGAESQEILEKMSTQVTEVTDDLEEQSAEINDLADAFIEYLKETKEKIDNGSSVIGLETGITELDEMTEGLREGQLWVVGAMTSGGKSALMMNVVNSVLNSGRKASVYSLEMSQNSIIARLLGIRMNISTTDIVKLIADKTRVWQEIQKLKQEGLKIYGNEFASLDTMLMSIVRDVSRGKTDVVFIDYIQLMSAKSGMGETEKLDYISRELRLLAGRTNVPIFLLSQLSNESVNNPRETAGFRGSGMIAMVANVAMVIRPDVEMKNRKLLHKDGIEIPTKIDIIKSQDSAVGYISCGFLGKTGVFRSLDNDIYNSIKDRADNYGDDFSDFKLSEDDD